MDLTSLGYILVFMIGMLGVDAVIHPQDIVLTSETIGSFEKTSITKSLVDDVITTEVQRIESTPTVMSLPVMRVGQNKGTRASP
jgi:hypothetical protein